MLPILLQRLRHTKGLTLEQAAAAMNIGRSTISSWEAEAGVHKRTPTLSNLRELLTVYAAEPEDRAQAEALWLELAATPRPSEPRPTTEAA